MPGASGHLVDEYRRLQPFYALDFTTNWNAKTVHDGTRSDAMDTRDGRILPSEFIDSLSEIDRQYMRQMKVDPTPLQRARGRVGRRELCPCGSGKKFKNCCEVSAAKK